MTCRSCPRPAAINTGATDAFSHSNESANAGYYAVTTSNGIKTELTATTRSGMARFTFPSSTQSNLIFKLNGSQNGDSATSWNVVSNTEVSGSVTSGNFCGAGNSYTMYFDVTFDQPFTTNGTAAAKAPAAPRNETTVHGAQAHRSQLTPQAAAAGPNSGYVTFNTTSNKVVQAKVGISYVSTANAVANRTAENPNWNFSATQTATHNAWNAMLGKIAGRRRHHRPAADLLHRPLPLAAAPERLLSDTNGQYMGFDNKVHTVDSGHSALYANYSGWDIYRSQAQLTALVAPSQASDIAQSMVDDYAQSGMFPKWAQNNGEIVRDGR